MRSVEESMFAEATEDGLVAVKTVDDGLVYYTPDEAELLCHEFQPWFRSEIVEAEKGGYDAGGEHGSSSADGRGCY